MARNLRAQPFLAKRPPQRPACKVHSSMEMEWDKVHSRWKCVDPLCDVVAYPPGESYVKPRVLEGPLELVIHTDDQDVSDYYLRHVESNILIHITDYVGNAKESLVVKGAMVVATEFNTVVKL